MNTNIHQYDLGDLADPGKYHDLIQIDGYTHQELIDYLQLMILIRKVEQQLAEGRRTGDIGGPVHLGVGQEAVAVGISSSLRKSDRVFGAHRSHSHILALNPDPYRLFAEVLGKVTGFSKGMGGSMHLWDQPNGFYGSVPIVSGTVSMAVGAGMAAKLQGLDDIAVAYFGDGAAEEGVVHESLNLARIQKAPVLFVVENNLFASHMHISLRQPKDAVSRFAVANDIPHSVIDGNDVVAVSDTATRFISDARSGKGPRLIELVTYRWYGHVDWRDDIDVGVHRSLTDVENWRARDPILRLSEALRHADVLSLDKEKEICDELDNLIAYSWKRAMDDPHPDDAATFDCIYA